MDIVTEPTDDGLYLSYLTGHATTYALGETEEESRQMLLERFDLARDYWTDAEESFAYNPLYA